MSVRSRCSINVQLVIKTNSLRYWCQVAIIAIDIKVFLILFCRWWWVYFLIGPWSVSHGPDVQQFICCRYCRYWSVGHVTERLWTDLRAFVAMFLSSCKWITSGQRISTKGRIYILSPPRRQIDSSDLDSSLINGVLDQHESATERHLDRFRRFYVHRSKDSQCFPMKRTTPKSCPFLLGKLDSHLTHDFLGPPKPATQTASWSVQPFLQSAWTWSTDTQTHRPTTVLRL